jgi:two-component system response regulator PilR (NtrC family)
VALDSDDFDLVISDIQMPGKSGLDLLRSIREAQGEALVVMITAFATTETAIAAMKEGAYDYLTKPFKVDEIKLVVQKALEKKLLTSENARLRFELAANGSSVRWSATARACSRSTRWWLASRPPRPTC